MGQARLDLIEACKSAELIARLVIAHNKPLPEDLKKNPVSDANRQKTRAIMMNVSRIPLPSDS